MNKEQADHVLGLRPGTLVEVRSEAEIRATLDPDGMLEGLPVMPEMDRFYGKVVMVHKRADKTCVDSHGMRRMRNTVFLKDVRCNGSAHDGCDRLCAIFWKEAWLKPAPPSSPVADILLRDLVAGVTAPAEVDPGKTFACQSTALLQATAPLPWWDLSQYGGDLHRGQLGWAEFAKMFTILLINKIRRPLGLAEYHALQGGNTRTPKVSLGLRPGDIVCLKSKEEIRGTLDGQGKTRGLEFSPEMTPYCGGRFTVLKRGSRMIVETTGKMIALNDSVLLEGLFCDGSSHRGCKRENLFFCKEAWLRRV